MKASETGLSFVIPAYNEEKGIRITLEKLQGQLESLGVPYEIVVVDDGSRDGTADIVSEFEDVILVTHPVNTGYGSAIKSGILKARCGIIGIIDADGSYPAEAVPELLAEMDKGFDMVVGARDNLREHDRPIKRLFRRLYLSSIQLLSGRSIPDPNSGLRLFRRQVALEFFDFLCNTFSFTTGLSIFAAEKPFFVKFIPVSYADRKGKSKVRHFRDSLRTVQLIIQGITYYNPLKMFIFMSIAMIFFVGLPAMVLALLRMHTLSSYYMVFGCTVALLLGLGVLADVTRVSIMKLLNNKGRDSNGGN